MDCHIWQNSSGNLSEGASITSEMRQIFMGHGISPSLSDTGSRPSYIASSVSSSLVAVLSLGCSSDGTSFYGIALG